MKKVGCITFHASHNYGSVLQAYALQEFIQSNFKNVDYKILNFRSQKQKDIYSIFPKKASLKHRIFFLFNYKKLKNKYENFENFINKKLNLTQEFDDENINESRFDFDCYISGGDQIWNTTCFDFSWLYYLPFVKKAKKISYAVSLGPKQLSFSEQEKEKIKSYVESYNQLSLREIESINQLEKLDLKGMQQNIDPVLLLNKDDWTKIIGERIEKSPYIFLYILNGDLQAYSFAKRLSKLTQKKVILTKPVCKKDFFHNFTNRFDCGPMEFLNYIYYADAVISTSFHGCVFASVFERPLFTLNADKDNRRKYFLEKYGLEERNINFNANDDDVLELLKNCDYKKFKRNVKIEQGTSLEYLKNAFGEEKENV